MMLFIQANVQMQHSENIVTVFNQRKFFSSVSLTEDAL